jgi:TPP-dependent pyruvate/acetoin dehydrogenase alpha subunit
VRPASASPACASTATTYSRRTPSASRRCSGLARAAARVRAYLTRSAGVDHDYFDEVDAEADKVAAELRAGCLSMPDPVLTDFFQHVYVEETPQLAEQRDQFVAYAASFSDISDGEG